MSTKFELPFDTCFACFQKSDDNCSCKSRKIYEQGKADGAREFAEWLCKKSDYTDIDINGFVTCGCGFSPRDTTIEQALKEWQKGKEKNA